MIRADMVGRQATGVLQQLCIIYSKQERSGSLVVRRKAKKEEECAPRSSAEKATFSNEESVLIGTW